MVEVREPGNWLLASAWLLSGVALLWFIATSAWIERQMSRVMRWALSRCTRLETYTGMSRPA